MWGWGEREEREGGCIRSNSQWPATDLAEKELPLEVSWEVTEVTRKAGELCLETMPSQWLLQMLSTDMEEVRAWPLEAAPPSGVAAPESGCGCRGQARHEFLTFLF